MEIANIQAEARDAGGTRAARRLRRQGKTPAVIYGHGESPENVAVPVRDLSNLLEHGAHLVELRLNGSPQPVLIKDVQFDHLGVAPIHVDFTRVDLNERVEVKVPLEFRGTPIGVHEGGLLDHDRVEIEIECLVTEIPESIRVNVSDLKLGDSLHVRDIELLPNVKAVTPAEAIICSVRVKAAEVEVAAPTEEAATQPEIIGRKEKEEAAAAAEGEPAKTKEKEKEKEKK